MRIMGGGAAGDTDRRSMWKKTKVQHYSLFFGRASTNATFFFFVVAVFAADITVDRILLLYVRHDDYRMVPF